NISILKKLVVINDMRKIIGIMFVAEHKIMVIPAASNIRYGPLLISVVKTNIAIVQ
ncbi:unnamed protein product, partial [marine sediment metagenome]